MRCLLALPPYFRFILAVQIARAWFNQQVHKPFHYVHLPSRPQNPNNQAEIELLSLEVLPAIFTLHNVHTCDVKVTWSKSKRLRRMTHEVSFRTVFPAKKSTKRHSRLFVSVSMRYLRHLDGIPEKWSCSLQLPFKKDTKQSTRMLVSGIFKQLGTFVAVPDGLRKFSKIGNVFFFRWSVWCQYQLTLYSFARYIYNFGLGKWAKIERKNGKLLCVKTSLVDWSVYTWAQSVSKTIRQNRMGFSYIIS